MSTVAERADAFRARHEADDPLRLVNVWDLVSARVTDAIDVPVCVEPSTASHR